MLSHSLARLACVNGLRRSSYALTLLLTALLLAVTPLLHAAPPSRPPDNQPADAQTQPSSQTGDAQEEAPGTYRLQQTPGYASVALPDLVKLHAPQQTIFQKDIDALWLKLAVNELKNGYMEEGRRDPKWDPGMLAALDEMVWCLEIRSSMYQRKKLEQLLRLPARFKCNDPRFYYMRAYVHDFATGIQMREDLATGVALAAEGGKSSRWLHWKLLMHQAMYFDRRKENEDAKKSRQQARLVFTQWLDEASPHQPAHFHYVWIHDFRRIVRPVDMSPEELQSKDQMLNAMDASAFIEPWLKTQLRAEAARMHAWSARGHGWASTVTEEGHRIWSEQNRIAYDLARHAHDANPKQPISATLLTELTWAGQAENGPLLNSRYWFEQVVAAMVDYRQGYEVHAWGLMPRWHGSLAEELFFARECALVEHEKNHTIPGYAMTMILPNIVMDLKTTEPIDPDLAGAIASLVFHVSEKMLKDVQDPRERQQIQQYLYNFMRRVDLPEATATVLEQMDKPYDPELPMDDRFEQYHGSTPYEMKVLAARNKPLGDKLTRAIYLEQYRQTTEEPIAIYRELLGTPDVDPDIAAHAAHRLRSINWQREIDTGQWVDLKFGPNLEGWIPQHGQWQRIDANTIAGTDTHQPMRIEPMIDLGKYFEIQMTIQFMNKPRKAAPMAGVLYAYKCNPLAARQYGLLVQQNPGATWGFMGYYEPYRQKQLDIANPITCTFRFEDGKGTILAGQEEIYEQRRIVWDIGNHILTLGTALAPVPGSIVQYSNIKVRKLPTPPEAPPDAAAE